MTDMVEKVAIGILCAEAMERGTSVEWDDLPEELKVSLRLQARAAIVAMRVPTDEMLDAADDPFHAEIKKQTERSLRLYGKRAYASCSFSEPLWKAMIDAALTPGAQDASTNDR